jgi:hypothetical protein
MTDIFDDNKTTVVTDATPTATIPDEVKELVGEGKKYGSVEAALKALPHAQSHIARLEAEAKELREKLAKQAAFDETVTALNPAAKATATPFDPAELDSVLDRKLKERADQQAREANIADFKAAMAAKYGDKAKEVFETKAKELGVGTDFLTAMVAKSATAGKEVFGLKNATPVTTATPGGKVNTAALPTDPSQPVKTVMGGAKTSDMVAAFRQAKAQANAKLGITN